MTGSCEHGNEHFGSIKGGKFLGLLEGSTCTVTLVTFYLLICLLAYLEGGGKQCIQKFGEV
jgi:hypothetical protein